MKKLITIIALLSLTACADNVKRTVTLEDTDTNTFCTVVDSTITCPDGSSFTEKNEVDLTKTPLPVASGCYAISHGLYAESIQNGTIFDVYLDSSCSDMVNGELNEVCDNVQPSQGSVGSLGFGEAGNATVCPFENLLIYGEVLEDILTINVLEVF